MFFTSGNTACCGRRIGFVFLVDHVGLISFSCGLLSSISLLRPNCTNRTDGSPTDAVDNVSRASITRPTSRRTYFFAPFRLAQYFFIRSPAALR